MATNTRTRNSIVQLVGPKAALRKQTEEVTTAQFNALCDVLNHLTEEYAGLIGKDVVCKFERPAKHVAIFTLDADALVFAQHTDVFKFDRDHKVWKTDYVTQNGNRAFVGVVNIYNFLADSFKYDRDEDMGYLVARLFIDAEGAFFVEGKQQRSAGVTNYGRATLDPERLRKIAETCIKYVAEFDLLVPPYDAVKLVDLAQTKQTILTSKTKTAKRMGFSFNSDDVR